MKTLNTHDIERASGAFGTFPGVNGDFSLGFGANDALGFGALVGVIAHSVVNGHILTVNAIRGTNRR